MNKAYMSIIEQMKEQGIVFQEQVTSAQLDEAEIRYGIRFPEELRSFYELAMPISNGFVNWLDDSPENVELIQKRLSFPVRGVLTAVELEKIWPSAWGICPPDEEQAVEIAKERMKGAALLIPVYLHRYVPYLEGVVDPPVLSVYGGDIIYYGFSLENWLRIEFCDPSDSFWQEQKKKGVSTPEIPGWQELIG